MKCFWPSTRATTAFLGIVFLVAISGILAWCSAASPSCRIPLRVPLAQRERTLQVVPAHISEFAPVSQPLAIPKCGDVRPPEALLTPDPLLAIQGDDLDVKISFIVGTDGHVHSAFVLDSGGPGEDQIVLRTVHFWRYRPALCNGVPTDSEALVRFSLH
jgi:Gram-negative bacterial TonB protein C-terminal